MKKVMIYCVALVLIPGFSIAAPHRQGMPRAASKPTESVAARATEMPEKISEKDRDYLMFTNFVGIVVNFVKLFMDPNNIPEAKQNAYNILNGINNLAHVITRSGLSYERQEELIMKIIEICKNYQVH